MKAAMAPASGRASHRGGAKGDVRPGDVSAAAQQMARMNVGEDDRRGPRRDRYAIPVTRPESLTDKTGEKCCASIYRTTY